MSHDERIARLEQINSQLFQAYETMTKFIANNAQAARENAIAQADSTRQIRELREETERIRQNTEQVRQECAESDKRHKERMDEIDLKLAEFTDKLNGLIGYIDGQNPR